MIRPVIRFNLKKVLAFAFIALGPLGNLLTPHFLPHSFRAYYFLLPFFPIFFFVAQERMVKIGVLFLPVFLYCFVSAYHVEVFGVPSEPFPVFRFFLLFCQFFFIIGAASSLSKQEELNQMLKTYINCYVISLAVGWVFFLGYYLELIPMSIIARFSVLAQFGWGLLRFSPGSYPNEYGIVSSFVLSILTLFLCDSKVAESLNFSKKWVQVIFVGTFLAFLLATTRAAYLSYVMCLIYVIWQSKKPMKIILFMFIFATTICSVLLLFNVDMFRVLRQGFNQRLDEGSVGERYFTWLDAAEQANESPLFGVGFASLTNIHNVYLQLCFELGFVGFVLLLGCLSFFAIEVVFSFRRGIRDASQHFLEKIRMIGLINVLSFAASNHNLNHHLTWFVFLICFASLRLPYLKVRCLSS